MKRFCQKDCRGGGVTSAGGSSSFAGSERAWGVGVTCAGGSSSLSSKRGGGVTSAGGSSSARSAGRDEDFFLAGFVGDICSSDLREALERFLLLLAASFTFSLDFTSSLDLMSGLSFLALDLTSCSSFSTLDLTSCSSSLTSDLTERRDGVSFLGTLFWYFFGCLFLMCLAKLVLWIQSPQYGQHFLLGFGSRFPLLLVWQVLLCWPRPCAHLPQVVQ